MRLPITTPLFALAVALAAACATGDDTDTTDAAGDTAAVPDSADHLARARAGADDPSAQPKPAGWNIRLDSPDRGSADDVYFVDMAPGWHVTTGPAAILYHPDSTASGSYALKAQFHLFDPGERHEGYGVFLGGRNLQDRTQRYTYFLLRRDGSFLVKTRNGADTETVRDWEEHDAVAAWDDRDEGAESVRNDLRVEVTAGQVRFLVNDQQVASVPASELGSTDGVFGLRVNHALNLHVTGISAVR